MTYVLAGLRISSEVRLPGVSEITSDVQDVVVRLRAFPDALPKAKLVRPDTEWDGQRMLIRIRGVARYLVARDQIDVDPYEGADPGDVRAYLMGTVLGALCHLREIFPLHASAIDASGGCVAFTGDSGAGKSTLVAALARRGHQVIADDIGFIEPDKQGRLCVWPGVHRLRLWESAVDGLGIPREGIEREFRGYDKFLVPLESPVRADAQRHLNAVYELYETPPGTSGTMDRLKGMEAVGVLLRNTYRLYIAEYMGRKDMVFSMCARIAEQVAVYRFSRPKDYGALEDTVALLERHFEGLKVVS
jgi:hypothetical protein